MTIGRKSTHPAKLHTTKRFGRRLKGWANYAVILPRWFYLLLVFFSGWGIVDLAMTITEGVQQ